MEATKENLKIWYIAYKKKYKRAEKYIKSRHGEIKRKIDFDDNFDFKKVSDKDPNFIAFEEDFRFLAGDNPNLSGKQIAEKMAKHDIYLVQYSELKHIEPLTFQQKMNIMTGVDKELLPAFYQEIKGKYHELIESGETSGAAALYISQYYFGSE